jgi:hypothetical protein
MKFKGTRSQDRIYFNWIVLGLNKNLYCFFRFLRCTFDELLHLPFSQRLRWKHIGENTYWRCLQNHRISVSNIILKLNNLHSNRFLWTEKTYLSATQKFLHFSAALKYQSTKLYWGWNDGPKGIKSSTNETIGNNEGNQVIWHHTQINIISSICYHLNWVENGKETPHASLILKVHKQVK